MSALTSLLVAAGQLIAQDDHSDIPRDDKGYLTKSWIWPEQAELIYGTIASCLVIGVLIWKAGPLVKQAMADRTARVQAELDGAAEAKATAETDAANIRQALGDIESERQRLFTEAEAQATAVLADGRQRVEAEIAELEAKADADIASMSSRSTDELRGEIARLSSVAVERVVEGSLDDATQQELIESFISRVGQTSGASS
jgi:F-type H+-transporting ATPase subunit b